MRSALRRLDKHVKDIDRRIGSLPPSKAGAFYASCAERFFPLYEAFFNAEAWGDPSELRVLLNLAWTLAARPAPKISLDLALERVLQQTPHADDFDSVETTLAQDVCILLSASLQAVSGDSESSSLAIDAAFEALRVSQCVEETGFLDLGSTPEAIDFEERFMEGELFRSEAQFQELDLQDLTAAAQVDQALVEHLRSSSSNRRYDVGRLLPTQTKLQ